MKTKNLIRASYILFLLAGMYIGFRVVSGAVQEVIAHQTKKYNECISVDGADSSTRCDCLHRNPYAKINK